MQPNKIVSDFDKNAYELIRKNIYDFLNDTSKKLDMKNNLILEIAPQVHSDVAKIYKKAKIETFDIDATSNATYIADLTKNNSHIIQNEKFDGIICMEVLEHTLNPFDATREIFRVLKKWWTLLMSTPYNFRIHWPLPDCWRFTRYWLLALLEEAGFKESIEIFELDTEDRDLMPIHYTVIAKK